MGTNIIVPPLCFGYTDSLISMNVNGTHGKRELRTITGFCFTTIPGLGNTLQRAYLQSGVQ